MLLDRLAALPPRRLALGVLTVLLAALATGIGLFGARLTAVRVTLLPGAEEASDAAVLGIGREGAAPDYRLDVLRRGEWLEGAVFQDTPIGEGLEWELPERLAPEDVTELRLIEVDRLDDDELERLAVADAAREDGVLAGRRYGFEPVARFDPLLGLDLFLDTPMGVLAAVGAMFATAVVALGRAARRR